MQCEYRGCEEEVFNENDLCILHINLPLDENSEEFKIINQLKEDKIEERKKNHNLNFKGVNLLNANFQEFETEKDIILTDSFIKNNLLFENAWIGGDVWADKIKIEGSLFFEMAQFEGSVSFFNAEINGNIFFDHCQIGYYMWFQNAIIGGDLSFNHIKTGGSISFKNAQLNHNVSFNAAQIGGNAWFDKAYIKGNTYFDLLNVVGTLNFFNTKFENSKGQERAYRSAKIIWERYGDRERADYNFYHEMEAKRKQKHFYLRYPELIVQYIFGYGVYPLRVLFAYIGLFFLFAFIYWYLDGFGSYDSLINKLKFSFITLIIPAYGVVIDPRTGFYGFLTIIQAGIGAFTWPLFVVIFARKFMR